MSLILQKKREFFKTFLKFFVYSFPNAYISVFTLPIYTNRFFKFTDYQYYRLYHTYYSPSVVFMDSNL